LDNLPVGTDSVSVAYSGDDNFKSSSTVLAQVINKGVTSTNLTSSINPAIVGQAVVFAAALAVNSPATGAPTGTITFMDGQNTLGSTAVKAGQAAISLSNLAGGAHSISAVYSGDGNFLGSTSSAVNEVINIPDFSLTVTSPSGNIATGEDFKTTIELVPLYGFIGPVTLTCNAQIPQGNCSVSPASGRFDGKTTLIANVTITTDGSAVNAPVANADENHAGLDGLTWIHYLPCTAVFALPLISLNRRRRKLGLLIGATLLAVGCGSSGGTQKSVKTAPPGNYTITMAAQSGTLSHSGKIALAIH